MRFAIVGDFDAVPWIPIMSALWSGLHEAGHSAVLVPMTRHPELGYEIVEQTAPDVVLFPLHHSERPLLGPWLERLHGRAQRVALCFDDPYDMATPLHFLAQLDVLLSPEPMAVQVYRDLGARAHVLLPVIDGRMHHPPRGGLLRPAPQYDILSVGGRQWRPRAEFMPQLEAQMRSRGLVFGEIAGSRRWVSGRELTAQLHATRLTFDLPRLESFSATNPHAIACTYAGPRIHIAAATKTPIVAIEPRPGTKTQFPSVPTCKLADSWATLFPLLEDVGQLAKVGEALFEDWQAAHTPLIRARELVALLA